MVLRFCEQAGRGNLVEAHKSEAKERNDRKKAPLCWWVNHINRDTAVKEIISTRKIKISRPNGNIYMATCTASHVPGAKHLFSEYDLHCNCNSDAVCSCLDFQTHGRACKHLRALRLTIEHWISQQLETPFQFPSSCEEAESLSLQRIESHIVVDNNLNVASGIPVPKLVQWDPAIIQNLGGDRTILGDDNDELCNNELNYMDDLNSDTEFGIGLGMVCTN